MAALNKIAKEYADDLREGIAWVIVWKEGRSWNASSVYLSDDDAFEYDDIDKAKKILEIDPNAVMLNGYYCGHFGEEMTAAEIERGIRWHYENECNTLERSDAFTPAPMERPEDLPEGALWYGKQSAEGPDPYVFDGYMDVDDFEKMHQRMAAEQLEEKPPDELELTIKLTAEQCADIAEVITPALSKAIDELARAVQRFTVWVADTAKQVAAILARSAGEIVDGLLYNANDHPKWWYLYKHAKKIRTRKKYRRRLMQQLAAKVVACAT